MEPKHLLQLLLPPWWGRVYLRTELQGESQWSWAAVGDDSVFYVFHSFGLFPSSLLSVSEIVYPSPLLPMTDREKRNLVVLLVFCIPQQSINTNSLILFRLINYLLGLREKEMEVCKLYKRISILFTVPMTFY